MADPFLAPRRRCTGIKSDGRPCGAPPLRDAAECFWHSPEHAAEAAEARRLGGLRRRREHAVSSAYEVGGLATVDDMRRLLDVAMLDTLALDNSVARNRTIKDLVIAAMQLRERGELDERLRAIEAALAGRPALRSLDPLLDDDEDDASQPEAAA